jgi:hypothetical protein
VLLGLRGGKWVVWACGPAFGRIWEAARITGKPDPRWQWLTISHGALEGIRSGHYLDISRDGRRIAVAEVERAEDRFSIAWILDGTMGSRDEPKLGDEVRMIMSKAVA